MSKPKTRISLTREELESLRHSLTMGQREDVLLVRDNVTPEITAAARARLEQMQSVNRAVYGARFPLSRAERARFRADCDAKLPSASGSI